MTMIHRALEFHTFESVDGVSSQCVKCGTSGTNPIHNLRALMAPNSEPDPDVTLNEVWQVVVTMHSEIVELRKEHASTMTKVAEVLGKIEPHLNEIAPMIEAIANNPMFKMLTGGGKKK